MKAEEPEGASAEEPGGRQDAGTADQASSTEDAAAQLDDARGALGNQAFVAESVRMRVGFNGSSLVIGGNLVIEGESHASGHRERVVVATIDITDAVDRSSATFVAPEGFLALGRAIEDRRMALLTGESCGTRTAAAMALRRAGLRPLLQLPGDLGASDLVTAVEQALERERRTGFLIDGVDSDTLAALGGFELDRLDGALGRRDGAIVLTSSDGGTPTMVHAALPVVEGTRPDADQIAERHADARLLSPEERARVFDVLALLARPISPRLAVSVVAAVADQKATAEEIAGRLHHGVTDDAVARWLRRQRSARSLAQVAAAVTFEGAPLADVDVLAEDLEQRLIGPAAQEKDHAPPKRFAATDRDWPEGLLAVGRERFSSHFGRHEAEVPRTCAPHDRGRVLAALWRQMGPSFRGPYLDWLLHAGHHGGAAVRRGAGISAGVLFSVDPLLIERDVLRSWAQDGSAAQRSCAALALGTPVVLGGDLPAARALVRAWAKAGDPRLRRTATLAYGGLLGAWDPGAAAAVHLWRLGADDPELRPLADAALASLTAAGREASSAREAVLGVLEGRLDDRRSRARVYLIVPMIARALTRPRRDARESLQALVEEEAQTSRVTYARLMARAFDSPEPGFTAASRALGLLLDAAARGRLQDDWMHDLVRDMRDDARARQRADALGKQLQRALRAERRRESAGAQAADRLLTLFFRTALGGTPS